MAHRIYFSVCGEGYGHSSRDMAIADVLARSGADVLMGSYGYVLERLNKNFRVVEVEREFEMIGDKGAFDLKATIFRSKNTALHFSRLISQEKERMEDFNATCVVADGRCAAVFAAFKLGLPCVIISNQTSVEPFFRECSFFIRLLGKPVELTLKTMSTLADNTLIPDFPPPHTICLNTLSRKKHIKKKQRFTGPLVAESFYNGNHNEKVDVETPFVLTLLGGHSFRFPIFEGILKIADRFPGINFLIFTKFESDSVPKNVKVSKFAFDISSYMQAAEIIITQAGHSTAMEILALGKPALIIPDKGQIEQESNARRMKELGVAETLDYASLDPESLYEKIDILLNDPGFKTRAKEYSELAKKMNGPQKATDLILELSESIQCY
ncbi:MAG: UDP-N-acetylglucosamine--N-acetylmuramyl-(pentapeptide) pyrophosphoryl-undecaprenol N-acetylglucosamine transferase [Candidatus Methanoperedens sp.]|nr:UDP-N-acetylglucosamine--N-acetylmuramyl-(pentapeptide) pyrophosphoryl-undecaprenol N-acetylglucosamine transferase [Candidatus Methanoperedens sp.]MCZ7371298.1 UDP-N-acetylglucosamine--N-acetylmuramyl-(pentapeptide) pyrophosphoryl-undecaprenol N-acetylglucosamine transferase [Candidatus Methanoperedens sp.]